MDTIFCQLISKEIDLINITFSFKPPRFIYKFYETVCQAWELTPIFLPLGDCS